MSAPGSPAVRRKKVATKKSSGLASKGPKTITKRQREVREAVARHVDVKVSARNTALNAIGGVKVDVFVRVRPPLEQVGIVAFGEELSSRLNITGLPSLLRLGEEG